MVSMNTEYLPAILELHDHIDDLPENLSKVIQDDAATESVIYWRNENVSYQRVVPEESQLPQQIEAEEIQKITGAGKKENSELMAELKEKIGDKILLQPINHDGEFAGLWILPDGGSVDHALVEKVAPYLGIGLEHRQVLGLSEKQNKRLMSLVEVGEVLTSQVTLEDVLKKLVQELHARFQYSRAAVLMKEGSTLRIAANAGFEQRDLDGYTFEVTYGITGRAVKDGTDQNVGDVQTDGDYLAAGEKGIHSEMAVPIRLRGEILGVLDAQSSRKNAFDVNDVTFLHTMARLAAVAIHNAKLIDSLASTKDYLSKLVDSSGDAIFAIDRDGMITTWNTGAERIYGYSRDEALGKHVDELVDPEEHSRSANDVIQLVKKNKGIYQEDEVIRKRKNGDTFPATPTYTLMRDESGVIGLSIIEKDLTFIKQATKLDAAKTLISTVTHYINNAITPLNGRAQIAEMQPTEENVETLIEVSLETTSKIQEVINTISEMKEFITTPYYNTSYIINLEEQLKEKLSELKGR